jgi:serine/threonine protein kinase
MEKVCLGRGAHGEIWHCLRTNTVVKTFATNSDLVRETAAYKVLQTLDPHNTFTPKIYGTYGASGIRMEFAGTDLMSLMSTKDPPDPTCLAPIGHGLQSLVYNGYLHNDVRAENIMSRHMAGGCSRTVLVDFGLMSRGPRRDLCTSSRFSWWLPPDGPVFWCACLNVFDSDAANASERVEEVLSSLAEARVRYAQVRSLPFPPHSQESAESDTVEAIRVMQGLVRRAGLVPTSSKRPVDRAHTALLSLTHPAAVRIWDAMMTSDFFGLGHTLYELACRTPTVHSQSLHKARGMTSCNMFTRKM